MWIRTVSGWEFFEVEYTSQGFPIIKPKQKCLDGSIFEYYLVKTKYGINKYIKEEVKPKQR